MSDLFVYGRTKPIREVYTLGPQLGQPGQYGVAREAIEKATHDHYAVKMVSKSRFDRLSDKRNYFNMMKQEIDIMKKLDHTNIIKLKDVFEDDLNLYLVMEKCAGGELFDRIQARGSYSEKDASKVLRQITEAIKYLHANHIAHCDLKPDNFLFATTAEDSTLKVIDFGMSKVVATRQHLRKLCGTPYYVAPEVIAGHYKEHCDMWSIGVVAFVLVFGFPPFWVDPGKYGRMADEAIFRLIKKGFHPETKAGYGPFFPKDIPVSDSVKDLISKLLVTNVADRLTAEEALDHPWLTGESASSDPLPKSVLKSLTTFHQSNKFRNAVLNMLSENLSQDRIDELKRSFKKLDKNGDGTVTMSELSECLTAENLTNEQIAQIMKSVDTDGDGVICYEELMQAHVFRQVGAKEERLWEAFRKLDVNGDGSVTATELRDVLGAQDAAELIKEADVNNDGVVDYHEFLKVFDKQYEDLGTAK